MTAGDVTIRPLMLTDAEACDAIILSLPYHFGNAGGRAECARAVRAGDGLVAERAGRVVGFVIVEREHDRAAEITWLAVEHGARGQGIGRALVGRLCAALRAEGRRLLLVMTLSSAYDEGDVVDGYARTRAFYRTLGFIEAKEFPDLWPGSPAVLFALRL